MALRRTDDRGRTMGGPDTGGGRLNTRYGRRGGKRTKGDRRWARCSVEQGTRTNLRGGGKEGTKIISDGKHRILKIGTESIGNHSLCSGLE